MVMRGCSHANDMWTLQATAQALHTYPAQCHKFWRLHIQGLGEARQVVLHRHTRPGLRNMPLQRHNVAHDGNTVGGEAQVHCAGWLRRVFVVGNGVGVVCVVLPGIVGVVFGAVDHPAGRDAPTRPT